MTPRLLPAALLRAGLVAAVLAIMAGILGMHVMTANHSTHAAGPAAAGSAAGATPMIAAAGHIDHSHHAGHAAVAHSAGVHTAGASLTAAHGCESACPGIQEGGAGCIPLAKAGSLAVFPPQGALAAHPAPGANNPTLAACSYLPPGPTPGELSISRT